MRPQCKRVREIFVETDRRGAAVEGGASVHGGEFDPISSGLLSPIKGGIGASQNLRNAFVGQA